ncbi:MAG: hypothetical protein GY822_14415, partial [Deltaproteobacteria bacterium]|nr:hypothetical protein [Deltaproteobacteria bacterium]
TVTITINGSTDGAPSIVIDDTDAAATAADNSVEEASGSTINGGATVTADAGVATVTVAGQDISNATATPVVIVGSYGTLTVTGYNAATGAMTYSYTEDGSSETHNAANDNIVDQFVVAVTDVAGESSNNTLDIQITDTAPVANASGSSITEDTTSVSGTVSITSGEDTDSVTVQNN